jgi:sulfur-oxidizing protein SoxY
VPIQVSLDHPMEADHYIRSIEVGLEADPVPHKGTFSFTPMSGRASVAFQMRSGTGGLVKAVIECSRHGRFVFTRTIRVAEGGCAGPPDTARGRPGNPRLRVPDAMKAGEVIQVRAKVDHNSYTGLNLKDGRYVTEGPGYYVKQMLVLFDDRPVCDFKLTSAVSANPIIRFPFKVTRGGTLRVIFVNSEGQRWEASQPIRV